ncbi:MULTISPECIES: protein kinase [unclassified Sphaerospermopsis]|uniref:protein kinase domain-containing protein n=1 Tax=unclassified Sphaerospermopsis TaxID=2646443 RepID=UPI0016802597|nr:MULTISPECIES: protein kinase [unclassified Sphaerospermopsis]MBD2131357.1 protein kinase [Sphaerospermopsis sp. FACHB-1094]MBD2146939.1 protein kinase [Sphaerospermopsis sp. FACHB-1194]
MPSTVTLTITTGKLSGKQYIFDNRSTCVIGRNDDCNLQIADNIDMKVSRYHCLLDINPPEIRIRDLGSLNGTYVNGKIIGQRKAGQTAEAAKNIVLPEYNLGHKDQVQIGDILFNISVKSEVEKQQIPELSNILENQKPNFLDIIKNILNLANAGNQNLRVISNYQIIKSLGEGGCGEVFLAQHQKTKKLVALKIMLPAVAATEQGVRMFLREVENSKCLQHPNVIQCLDYDFAGNTFFFAMEYCEGGDVWDLMEKLGGSLPVNLAVDIILQVLDGLEYAHNVEVPYVRLADGRLGKGKGLVHRDLKPNNIFITKNNGKMVVKIGDYGLAKAFDLAGLSGQTFTGTKMGTPVFMPRQQVLDFKHSLPEVDVWASAACLYNMLTGKFPRDFDGDPWSSILNNPPVPIRERDSSIPEKLAQVIDLALTEKPQIYFQTAIEFKEALLKTI